MSLIKQANWIHAGGKADCPKFSKTFLANKPVKKATLYASAMGLYKAYVNGVAVTDAIFTPGWTSYGERVQYQAYDITPFLAADNRLDIKCGNGWAVGHLSWLDAKQVFSDKILLIAALEIEYTDGSVNTLLTDESWDIYNTDVTYTDIYHGETRDFSAEEAFVCKAEICLKPKPELIAQQGEYVTEKETVYPVSFIVTPKGEKVIDFGQNLTGYAQISIKGQKGGRVVLSHAEVLDKHGNFYNENFRSSRNINTYILSGKEDTLKPLFSFQGFRYIRLDEYPSDKVDLDNFCAKVVFSDIKRDSRFVCGNGKLNRLYNNIIWSQKGNFLELPTDCPQRDERLGWTGDAQVFCKTAAINYDVYKFFDKWLTDVVIEQHESGAVSGVVPDCVPGGTLISAGYGDAITICPWQLYEVYGNTEILKKCFPAMVKWINYIKNTGDNKYLWLGGTHYGDWLALDAVIGTFEGATDKDLIASAFYAYSTQIAIRTGKIIGEDVKELEQLYQGIFTEFRSRFMSGGLPKGEPAKANGQNTGFSCYTQTAIVLILYFNLYKEHEREKLTAALVDLIEKNDVRMSTGFLGTPYILHALSLNGRTDTAYKLLLQEKKPSWLFSVNKGATTIWEHWDGIDENGDIWSNSMNSFNHYAYGSVFDWIFKYTVGINITKAGFGEIVLKPVPDKDIGFVVFCMNTVSGPLSVNWYYSGGMIYYSFELPKGINAKVILPSGLEKNIAEGIHHFAERV